jgi:hypothetical protein
MRIPKPQKNSRMSAEMADAPDAGPRHRSMPSFARSLDSTSLSAIRCCAARSGGMVRPASSSLAARMPVSMAHAAILRLAPLGSAARPVSMAALNFCHTRGTAKNECGRASGSASASFVRSATQVTWMPNRIGKY